MEKKTKRLGKSEHVTWKKLGEDRSLILDLNSGQYFSLNETATAIWQSVVSNKSHLEIAKDVSERFEIDTVALEGDIQEVVGFFMNKGIVSDKEGVLPTEAGSEKTIHSDFTQKPYIKPEIKEHESIRQVTAATSTGSGGSHYWYPC
jgi:hypothetical protein